MSRGSNETIVCIGSFLPWLEKSIGPVIKLSIDFK